MVLRIKEREEAIQLLAMDPQVCGKLLTLHRKGNGVDVEALRDQIPSGRVPEKVPRWDLTGTEGCGSGKVFSWMDLVVRGYLGIYIQPKELGQEGHGGPTRVGGAPYPPGRALHPCGHLVAPLTSSPTLLVCFWSKKNHCEGFIPFGLRWVFLFCETQNKEKQKLALGSRLIGQSQK